MIQTYDRIADAFPSEGVTADVVVEADDVRSGEVQAGIDELVAEAQASDSS